MGWREGDWGEWGSLDGGGVGGTLIGDGDETKDDRQGRDLLFKKGGGRCWIGKVGIFIKRERGRCWIGRGVEYGISE